MPASKLSTEEWETIHNRALAGESLTSLAKEQGMFTANVSRLLRHRFGFRAERLRPATISPIDDPVACAYIAGLIDGEGCVHWRLAKKTRPSLTIAMSDREPLAYVASFAGHIYEYQPKNRPYKMYRWQLARGKDVEIFLHSVLPYMRVPAKRAKAESALAFFGRSPKTAREAWGKVLV